MTNNDLSNEAAPTFLFHYSYVMDEEKVLFWRRLRWKEPLPPILLQVMGLDWCNVAIYVDKTLYSQCEVLTERIPFRRIYTYENLLDIKRFSFEPWHKIAVYYDTNPVRGQFFGSRWQTE